MNIESKIDSYLNEAEKQTQPYQIIHQRVDKVIKLPDWLKDGKEGIKVGDLVYRIDSSTVKLFPENNKSVFAGKNVKLGQSYTKFVKHEEMKKD